MEVMDDLDKGGFGGMEGTKIRLGRGGKERGGGGDSNCGDLIEALSKEKQEKEVVPGGKKKCGLWSVLIFSARKYWIVFTDRD